MRKIFLLMLCGVFGLAGCESDETEHDLLGKWEVTWIEGEQLLFGELEVTENNAHMIAFGNEDNAILHQTDQADYFWQLSGEALTLIRKDSQLEMPLRIYKRESDSWEFTYMADTKIKLRRFRESSYVQR